MDRFPTDRATIGSNIRFAGSAPHLQQAKSTYKVQPTPPVATAAHSEIKLEQVFTAEAYEAPKENKSNNSVDRIKLLLEYAKVSEADLEKAVALNKSISEVTRTLVIKAPLIR